MLHTQLFKTERAFGTHSCGHLAAGWVLALLLLTSSATAQLSQPIAQPELSGGPTNGEWVEIADEALPQQADPQLVNDAIVAGAKLEKQLLWAEAVSHYDEALRATPGNAQLEERLDYVRLRYSIVKRCKDRSYVESVRTLSSREALDLYSELLSKVESHYVVNPPWNRLARRGIQSVLSATRDKGFNQVHGLRPSDAQVSTLQDEVRRQLSARGEITSMRSAKQLARDVAGLAEYRLGVPQSATILEFAAATAEGLDTYSSFLTPGQLRDVYAQIEGNFVGLGVELKADDSSLLIVRTIKNSPAERAGIVAGDRIIAVDGHQTADLSTEEAASLLTGEEGSIAYVTLASTNATQPSVATNTAKGSHTVAKPVVSGPRVVAVRREHVEVPSLEEVKILDADYGVAYVRIPVFQKSTSRDLESALWDLHRQGMRSLVIDLRGNPGGLLISSVELVDKFVAQGNIVFTRGRSEGEDVDYRAHRSGTWRVPLVVMIDGDSASASEIFAAAIRDNRRGTIVGARSFGKGSVQGIFPMTQSGAGIRLTTAKFFSPNGQPISKVGVSPDIVVRQATRLAEGEKNELTAGNRQVAGYRGPDSSANIEVQDASGVADQALSRAVEAARRQVALR